jgi:hypothetical protein
MKFIFLLTFIFISPASAAEPSALQGNDMDFTVIIKDIHGNTIPDITTASPSDIADLRAGKKSECGSCSPLTLQSVAVSSLLMPPYQDPRTPPMSAIDKFKRDRLAAKIQDNPHIALSGPELALLDKAVGEAEPIAIIGPAMLLLDPAWAKENEIQ